MDSNYNDKNRKIDINNTPVSGTSIRKLEGIGKLMALSLLVITMIYSDGYAHFDDDDDSGDDRSNTLWNDIVTHTCASPDFDDKNVDYAIFVCKFRMPGYRYICLAKMAHE